jgi:hypothetical protein
MPIRVRIQNEHGEPLDEGWDDRLSSTALAAPDTKGHCLPFIDPYGDTVFNQLQLPELIGDLMDHRRLSKNEGIARTLDSLIFYLQSAEDRAHVYVEFIGD